MILASCGEQEKKQEDGASSKEEVSRSHRPAAREDSSERDVKFALRQSFENALAEPDAVARERALEQIAWDGIDVDMEIARKAFEALEPGGAASRKLIAHFAGRLADTDPGQAIEWARGLEDAQERAEAFGRIAVVVSARDPEQAAVLAMAEVPEGIVRDRAVVQIVQRWSQGEPGSAAAWIATLPSGASRTAGVQAVVIAWGQSDPAGLATWIEGRAGKMEQMEYVLSFASAIKGESEEARAQKLAAFHDAEIRRQVENLLAQMPP